MSDKPWKVTERRVAKMAKGKRNPVGTGLCDVASEWLVIEVKHREKLPKWIADDLDKARRKAQVGQLGLVLLHQKYSHDDVIIMARSDFENWFGWSRPEDDDTIDDGFGSVWSAWCCRCGEKSMSIVRPGKVQCGNCGG